jgi:hypothetical protein
MNVRRRGTVLFIINVIYVSKLIKMPLPTSHICVESSGYVPFVSQDSEEGTVRAIEY